MDRFWDILGGIVLVALATTLVAHKNTGNVIRAGGASFSESLKAAEGGL